MGIQVIVEVALHGAKKPKLRRSSISKYEQSRILYLVSSVESENYGNEARTLVAIRAENSTKETLYGRKKWMAIALTKG